jgi:hypothetical protein
MGGRTAVHLRALIMIVPRRELGAREGSGAYRSESPGCLAAGSTAKARLTPGGRELAVRDRTPAT